VDGYDLDDVFVDVDLVWFEVVFLGVGGFELGEECVECWLFGVVMFVVFW